MNTDFVMVGTKFSVPTPLHTLIPRQRICELLDQSVHFPLTLLSAPASYGKTSALSTWLLNAHTQYSACWVSLDTEDDQEYHFWLCVACSASSCA